MEMLIQAAASAPRRGGVQVQIRDASGRVQRTARVDYASTGAARWRWDLRDAAGRPMSAGVYWVTARPLGGASAPVTRSLVVVP
jgi:flagellar hook assembly protein FlgD